MSRLRYKMLHVFAPTHIAESGYSVTVGCGGFQNENQGGNFPGCFITAVALQFVLCPDNERIGLFFLAQQQSGNIIETL